MAGGGIRARIQGKEHRSKGWSVKEEEGDDQEAEKENTCVTGMWVAP